jgi:hypothetical protein
VLWARSAHGDRASSTRTWSSSMTRAGSRSACGTRRASRRRLSQANRVTAHRVNYPERRTRSAAYPGVSATPRSSAARVMIVVADQLKAQESRRARSRPRNDPSMSPAAAAR